MELAAILPGVLTGFAALIAALAAILKRSNNANDTANDASENSHKTTEVTNDAVDVIEKIVDGQSQINRLLMGRLQEQDQLIIRLRETIESLQITLKHEREERSNDNK
jgi:hypothetical protein